MCFGSCATPHPLKTARAHAKWPLKRGKKNSTEATVCSKRAFVTPSRGSFPFDQQVVPFLRRHRVHVVALHPLHEGPSGSPVAVQGKGSDLCCLVSIEPLRPSAHPSPSMPHQLASVSTLSTEAKAVAWPPKWCQLFYGKDSSRRVRDFVPSSCTPLWTGCLGAK